MNSEAFIRQSFIFFLQRWAFSPRREPAEGGSCRVLLCQLQPQQPHIDQLPGMLQAVQGSLVPPRGSGRGCRGQRRGVAAAALGRRQPRPFTKGKGKGVLRLSSTPGPELPQGRPGKPAPARAERLAGPLLAPDPPDPRSRPRLGSTTWPADRHVLSRRPGPAHPPLSPAAQSGRRRRAAALSLANADSSRAGSASPRSRPPPHRLALAGGCNALSRWLIAKRRRLAEGLEGRGRRLAGRRGARGDWLKRGRRGRGVAEG